MSLASRPLDSFGHQLLKQLHWLTVEWWIRFKLASLVYKVLKTGHRNTLPYIFPSVLWYCWLGLLTCKNRLPYNLYCVGGYVKHCTIQSAIPYRAHTISQALKVHAFICQSLTFCSATQPLICTFRVAVPKIWNSIPLHIRQSQTYSSFRRHFRTHYFQSVYPAA